LDTQFYETQFSAALITDYSRPGQSYEYSVVTREVLHKEKRLRKEKRINNERMTMTSTTDTYYYILQPNLKSSQLAKETLWEVGNSQKLKLF